MTPTGHDEKVGYAGHGIDPGPDLGCFRCPLGFWPWTRLSAHAPRGQQWPRRGEQTARNALVAREHGGDKSGHAHADSRSPARTSVRVGSAIGPKGDLAGGIKTENKTGACQPQRDSCPLFSAQVDAHALSPCLPLVSVAPSLQSPSMNNIHDSSLADFSPRLKRPRFDDQPPTHPPPSYNSGPPGPSTSAIPDQDGATDAASKKNRKRPLSCGECRRYVCACSQAFCDSPALSVRPG